MRHSVICCLFLTSLCLVPSVARPAALSVNGTCEVGTCAAVDSVSYGQTIPTTPFTFNYTVGSDTYGLSGNYTSGYDTNGTNIGLTLSATYLGTAPTTSADTLTVHLLQNFFDNGPIPWDGTYTEHLPIFVGSTVGSGSTLAGQLSFDGQSIGVVGPYGPGTYDVTKSADLAGLTGDTLSSDFNVTMSFAAGTQSGAIMSVLSSVPEPSQFLPVGLALALFGMGALHRRRYSSGRTSR